MYSSVTADDNGDGVEWVLCLEAVLVMVATESVGDRKLTGLGAHDEGGVDEMMGRLCNVMWGGWVV